MVKAYKIQVNKKNSQAFITIPKVIMDGKDWKERTELRYRIGPKGEVILEDIE
ncbi:MAG: hypothetical protein ABIH11_07410 [Candidatus Altiarchaeota archaeon]